MSIKAEQPALCLSMLVLYHRRIQTQPARLGSVHAKGTADRCCVLSMAATTELDLKFRSSICGSGLTFLPPRMLSRDGRPSYVGGERGSGRLVVGFIISPVQRILPAVGLQPCAYPTEVGCSPRNWPDCLRDRSAHEVMSPRGSEESEQA